MKLDLPNTEHWESLNERVKKILNLNPGLQVRVYKDLSSSVLEVVQGTAQFLSHKKSVGFIRGQSPAFDFLLPHFYKEAYQVKHSSYVEFGDVAAWVEALNKDTAFVIYAEDHPVTGELYDFCDELDLRLSEKRIFSVRVSHACFLKKDLEVRPYSIRLCSWSEDFAIAICGEKFRSPPLVAPRQTWAIFDVLEKLTQTQAASVEDSAKILSFEKNMTDASRGISSWFAASPHRLWDRAVLQFSDVSGEALSKQLQKKLASSDSGEMKNIETTNMCRWGATRLYQSWWEPLPKPEVLRGLMIFDAAILDRKDFESLLLSSYEEIKSLQSW